MARRRQDRKRNKRRANDGRGPSALPPAYRDALLAIEAHERPPGYAGLNGETRRAASDAQFISFAQRYWFDWRHTKIRLYRFLLEERDSIARREGTRWSVADFDPEDVVYNQVTNGILASAASEFCQYVEDLAVLARACASEQYFARDLSEAQAGKMQKVAKSWATADEQATADLLQFPLWPERHTFHGSPIGEEYLNAVQRAVTRLRAVGELYSQWEFHFMRYKHGLLLALSQGASPTPEFFAQRRNGLGASVAAFDCGAVLDPANRTEPVFAIPDIGERSAHVRLNAAHLAAERNLLRLVHPTPLEPSIELFEQGASYVSQLQRVLLRNREQQILGPAHDPYYMPSEDPAAVTVIRSAPPDEQVLDPPR